MERFGSAGRSEGYTFASVDTVLTPNVAEEFAFRITGPEGAPVTRFDVEQDKLMHLIVGAATPRVTSICTRIWTSTERGGCR